MMQLTMKVRKFNAKLAVWVCLTLLIGLLLFSNPQNVPIVILIVPFILFFIILTIVIAAGLSYMGWFSKSRSHRRRYGLSATIAGLPVTCLVLKSIGQFSTREFLTLLVLFGMLIFYVNRVWEG